MITAALTGNFSGSVLRSSCRLYYPFQVSNRGQFRFPKNVRMPILRSFHTHNHIKCAAEKNYHQDLQFQDRPSPEPLWLSLIKDVACSLRSLVDFLAEQPRQLKYIEWPSFQSTLKTATLTLVLVAFLIVALSSIDSALCYMLALLLRRTT